MLESFQDFLIQLDMRPRIHLVKISIFSLTTVNSQTYPNYEQPPWTSQNSDFQSYLLVWKIDLIFPFFYFEYFGFGYQLLKKKIFFEILTFKMLYFLKMCVIFVGSVNNFGKSDGDII